MSQRQQILSQIAGYRGWKVQQVHWENDRGQVIEPIAGFYVVLGAILVITMKRRWTARCGQCGAIAAAKLHERRKPRRWKDLPWAGHRVVLQYEPERIKCQRCGANATELLPWAQPKQRQTSRLQQHLALDAFSMPLLHVATKYGLSWHTVRRAETDAIERWERARPERVLRQVGVDEKWLGRRHKSKDKYVTVVSDLQTGEPVWIGYGRDSETLKQWLATLTPENKANIELFACDMHAPFMAAIGQDQSLAHAPIVHDPFHVMKRAGEAISELRREVFFRANDQLRAIGRGTRWLVLRAWDNTTDEQKRRLRLLFSLNGKLARAYQTVEELREVLKADDENTMSKGLSHVLYRTEKRTNVPMRKLHESLKRHFSAIVALGKYHPPTGRIEALNGNWETLVRRGRGYRNHQYLLRKLRFITANPVRNRQGILRFLALGLVAPCQEAA
jgi:transposase